MKKVIAIIITILITCLVIAAIVSIDRARSMRGQQEGGEQTETSGEMTTEQPGQAFPELEYTEYTGKSHPGTGIAYKGSGENAQSIIVIDAGHQLHAMSETEPNGPGAQEQKPMVSGGTQGSVTGLAEYELNLLVALALRDVLVEKGYTVVMIRETNEVEISNAERARIANEVGAHVNLRIHANGDTNAELKGAMAVCQTHNNPYNANIYMECRALSDAVLSAFCEGTGMEQLHVWETDTMTGTNWAKVPTTILEMGFMTNAEDEAAMAADAFAAKAAEAIAKGIENYLGKSDSTETTKPEETTDPEQTTKPEGTGPSSEYDINYELEEEIGESFTEVYITMEATATVWVRTEPSTRGGDSTKMHNIAMYEGKRVTCIGLGQNWNRVLIDGKVYYISAAYLREVEE